MQSHRMVLLPRMMQSHRMVLHHPMLLFHLTLPQLVLWQQVTL
jgi:hypothetical protein